ncbi:MAG: carbohydrate porin [Melioribacteraceae bacterium]
MKRIFILLAFLSIIQYKMNAQQQTPFNIPFLKADSSLYLSGTNLFTQEASYIGDFAGNLTGGKKTGTVYLGIANIKLSFDTKNIGLWEGGEFFVNGACTHGATPSEKLLGDFQVASNIEAGDHIFIQELWYKHSIDKTEITIGLQDINTQFVTSEFASSFINSSFGIPSLISDNVPVPIFPLTALGITGKVQLNESLSIQAALFDGMPENFENNQYNLDWNVNKNNGALIFTELQLTTNIGGISGTIKTGGYYHTRLDEVDKNTGSAETIFNENYGFYLITDQTLWKRNENCRIGLFAQFAVSPGGLNMHNHYLGGGIDYQGVFTQNGDDALGLAFANACFNCDEMKNETTIELFYKSTITEKFFIQPDIQYIINPAGAGDKLNNALAVFMRFGINF